MTTRARTAARAALKAAGLYVDDDPLLDALVTATSSGTREEAVDYLRARYELLDRGTATKLVDLTREALELDH